MKNTNKILSIILAILMIVTTVPFAFATDETPDFSDAKVLTSVDGMIYIDGVEAETSGTDQYLPTGEYILTGNITTSCYIYVSEGESVALDLNGYVWDMGSDYLHLNGVFSLYDTSENETGKIMSSAYHVVYLQEGSTFSLYSGTVENTGKNYAVSSSYGSSNLYGGKVKSNGSAIQYYSTEEIVINLDGTVIECGDGYAEIGTWLGGDGIARAVIDVSDYTGEGLTVDIDTSEEGIFRIFKGIKNSEYAENYKINYITFDYGLFFEKEEYNEETGEKFAYITQSAFTQQPTAENNYTADFNNPAATFQWYEIEENNVGTYIAEDFTILFEYDFKAGDILMVSTDSELRYALLECEGYPLRLNNVTKTATKNFDTDETARVMSVDVEADNPVELEFSIVNETALDGETGETLQNPECGKSYLCKATVGDYVYITNVVVGHIITSVPAKEKTCTTIGWDAYKYCTECDYTTYAEIPASHEIVNVEAKANTCTEIGWDAYEYCTECDYTTYVEIPDLGGHINEDGDTLCDRCGETILCEDCGRPVHGDTIVDKFVCWIVMLFNLIKSIF